MNQMAEQVMAFMDKHPKFKGKFIGWRPDCGLGVSRIDDRWYLCDDYLISIADLEPLLETVSLPQSSSKTNDQEIEP